MFYLSALILTDVKEGQLVLCTKTNHDGLCRAVVKEVRPNNVVSVKYFDYSGEDVLTLNSIRNVDEFLASQPAALLLSPEIWYLNNLTIVGTNFINEFIARKEKPTVVSEQNTFENGV